VPEEAALRDWDRAIVAEVARCIAAGDTEAGIAAFVTAWNEVAWSALPDGVRARLLASAAALAADMHAVSFCELAIDRIARMPMPVMLLQGALSPAITHAMTARLGALLPESRCVAIPGCGHMGPAQNPMAIASTMCFARPAGGYCAAEL
jgi:pimeloyl-ACP methyl ester carboxylesterase